MRLQLLGEIFRMSIDSLRTNKLRSFLTILGIVIGVMTVIGMVSVIQGLNASMMSELESAGSDLIMIQKYDPVQMGERSEEERNRKDLVYEDALAIEQECPSVKAVAVSLNVNVFEGLEIKYRNNKNDSAIILGINETWPEVYSLYLPRIGRHIAEADITHKARVCVLGSELADSLFPYLNPLNKEIRIGAENFTVIGVLNKRGQIFGQSRDNFVAMPVTTLTKYFPYDKESLQISAVPVSHEKLNDAREEIINLLRRRRNVGFAKANDFAVFTQETLVDLYNQLTGAAYMVMIIISSIGLLVGGIGVMNIMLVSVKERTREIGIRKAIGARAGDIMKQFLIEAVVLTGGGGLLGVIIGSGIALIVRTVTPLPASVSLWSVGLGLAVAFGVGLFFGIFPAQKAARVDPIVSLRYE